MTKFNYVEANSFLRTIREEMKINGTRLGQQLVNSLNLEDPHSKVFYSTDEEFVLNWFYDSFVDG